MKDYSEDFVNEVTYLDKKGGVIVDKWPSWKPVSECSQEELEKSNLVKVGYCELVLDVDRPEMYDSCISKLEEDGFSYEEYPSGSEENRHIHLEFEELKWLNPEANKKLKAFLIERYLPGDSQAKAKASNRNCIAQINKPHFKTGRIKSLIKRVDNGVNILPGSILFSFINSLVTPLVVDSVESCNVDNKGFAEVVELVGCIPKVFGHFKALSGDEKPLDRSGSDFVLIKYLIERGVAKDSIKSFLFSLKWSDVHFKDKSYFDFSYNNALRRVQDYKGRCKNG